MKKLNEEQIMARAGAIQLVFMDVDGVLTDGRIILTSNGEEAKSFNVKDGHGIAMSLRAGLKIAWVSGRKSDVTRIRAEELGVTHLSQGEREKLPIVKRIASELGVPLENAAFIGDDVVDLEPMQAVGLAIAVADALPQAREAAHWITGAKGGHGAVREVLDIILQARSSG